MHSKDMLRGFSEQVTPVLSAFSRHRWREYALRYALGLTLLARSRSIAEISRSLAESTPDKIHHFLHDSPWQEGDAHRAIQRQVAEKIGSRPVTLVIDDTVIERKGKHIEGIGVHHTGTGLVKGQCAVTAVLKIGGMVLAFAMKGYRPRKGCPRGHFRSKVDLAMEVLTDAAHLGRPLTVLMDCWYACARLLNHIATQQWRYVAAIKRNRLVWVNGRKSRVGHLAKGPRSYHTVRLSRKRSVRVAKKVVVIRRIGTVALFITKTQKCTRYLVSNDTTLTGEQAVRLYAQRWCIETFHRDIKQHLGCRELWVRSWRAVQRHWTLLIMTYNALCLWNAALSWRSRKHTFGQIVRAFRSRVRDTEAARWCDHYALAA